MKKEKIIPEINPYTINKKKPALGYATINGKKEPLIEITKMHSYMLVVYYIDDWRRSTIIEEKEITYV